jgi:hypothetical protein
MRDPISYDWRVKHEGCERGSRESGKLLRGWEIKFVNFEKSQRAFVAWIEWNCSGGEANDFEFGRSINSSENLVDSKHGLMLQFRFAALAALKNRQRLHNHDGGVTDFERKIGYAVLQQSATDMASHSRTLLRSSESHST